jgi:hypothetical protein
MAINCRYQAWLPAEFFGPRKHVAELNDRSRPRFDIASISRKPVWKIDYYADASCALGAEHASEITQGKEDARCTYFCT